ncbi:DUF4184 family protein [Paraclostridium sordellii]|uniref:DUF4184 family protein n=1 Tax=Paraclostridium sordellii TaxID=1505 RepID=UPI00096AA720|nr:DUF4184 family protein [Paeniclostridium sordellii]
MPFTLAHPAAVIFTKNKYFNLMGLILGSMAPDFIYFILFNPISNLGHTFLGFLFLNLPLCYLLNYLINNFIKVPFILNLPFRLSRYYIYLLNYKVNMKSTKNIIVFGYSCILGMITHVLWDSFTHPSGFFVLNINFLRTNISFLNFQIPLFKIIQHGSTLIGILLILIYLNKIKKVDNKHIISNKLKYHFTAISIQFVVIIFSYMFFNTFGIGRLVTTFVNGLFIGYLISSILYINKISTDYDLS